jgi:hypothetical protein
MCFLLNMLIHSQEAEKLATSHQPAMCKAFSLRWVPSMEALLSGASLKNAASVDSSSAVWRKVQNRRNFFEFLYGSSQQCLI